MQVTFPANTLAKEAVAVQATRTPVPSAALENVASHSAAAGYFNPKLTVDAKSGMVLVQYRSQDGEMRLQIPSQSVVKHYTMHGYRKSDPPGTMPEPSEKAATSPSPEQSTTTAAPSLPSSGAGETDTLA